MWRAQPFLAAYRSMPAQMSRLERILAVGRAFLAVSALTAIYFDPSEPVVFASLVYALLAAYAVYSLVVLSLVDRLVRLGRRAVLMLHGVDVCWAAAITFFSNGAVSPYFLFFLFVLLASAYRWGFRETFATALLVIVIFLFETTIALVGPWDPALFADNTFTPTRIVTRVSYLLLTGGLLAYLAEEDKQLRAEVAAAADAVSQPRSELGFSGSVVAVARLLARVFAASGIDVVIHDDERGRTTRWSIDRDAASANPPPVPVAGPERTAWLFAMPAPAWCSVGPPRDGGWRAVAPDPSGVGLRALQVNVPADIGRARAFASLAVVDIGLPGQWTGRIYLFDATPMPRALPFLESIAQQISPGLSNVFLLRRLRQRAGAAERARVARELHDGSIQALIGIELEVAALTRVADRDAPGVVPTLTRVQELLRQEIVGLRELMQQLQPVDLDTPHHLPEVLSALTEKFRKDSGIAARFVSLGTTNRLPLATTHEIVRIVQEALVNVRRHSRARNVLVRFGEAPTGFTLSIEDDGCGFDFEGRLTGAELAARRIGPAMIQQRARLIGASLTVESVPGTGSRLEIAHDAP